MGAVGRVEPERVQFLFREPAICDHVLRVPQALDRRIVDRQPVDGDHRRPGNVAEALLPVERQRPHVVQRDAQVRAEVRGVSADHVGALLLLPERVMHDPVPGERGSGQAEVARHRHLVPCFDHALPDLPELNTVAGI